jgi:hypothetical protein
MTARGTPWACATVATVWRSAWQRNRAQAGLGADLAPSAVQVVGIGGVPIRYVNTNRCRSSAAGRDPFEALCLAAAERVDADGRESDNPGAASGPRRVQHEPDGEDLPGRRTRSEALDAVGDRLGDSGDDGRPVTESLDYRTGGPRGGTETKGSQAATGGTKDEPLGTVRA